MKSSPFSKVDDGYLDVSLMFTESYIEYLKTFNAFMKDGAHVFMENVCK